MDGGFFFQWEPMEVTMSSVIAPEVAFYMLQQGLIMKDPAWWIVEQCLDRICVSPMADFRQNRHEERALVRALTSS